MKTSVIKTLLFFALIFFQDIKAQTYNNLYNVIDVINNQGQNPHDFAFSYDVINGQHTCSNNFEVISNVNFISTFRFKIFINNIGYLYRNSHTTAVW